MTAFLKVREGRRHIRGQCPKGPQRYPRPERKGLVVFRGNNAGIDGRILWHPVGERPQEKIGFA